jgi:hypothetical protein
MPWRDVDNPDELADEIRAYDEARRLLRLYTLLLQQTLPRRGGAAVAAVAAVKRTIDGLPVSFELMHGFYRDSTKHPQWSREWVWQFHAAYLEFSATNTHSRSWLLFTLKALVQELNRVRDTVAQSERIPASEQMRERALAAYEKWRALAEPRLRVPLAALRAREVAPRSRRAHLTDEPIKDSAVQPMPREPHADIQAMRALLQQHADLGLAAGADLARLAVRPNDPEAPLDAGFWARQQRYWGDLERLRADNAALEAKLKEAVERMRAAEAARDAAVDRAHKARNELIQFKLDTKRAQEREERARAIAERDRTETEEERRLREMREERRKVEDQRYWA